MYVAHGDGIAAWRTGSSPGPEFSPPRQLPNVSAEQTVKSATAAVHASRHTEASAVEGVAQTICPAIQYEHINVWANSPSPKPIFQVDDLSCNRCTLRM